MRFASLGSGSQGNATLIEAGDTRLLLDCGFSLRNLTERLAKFDLSPEQLTAVLVTHEHSDHIRGVGPLSRKYQLPVYMTAGTAAARSLGRIEQARIIQAGDLLNVGEVEVACHSVPHDAREPLQFTFEHRALRLGILTDLGNIPDSLAEVYRNLDALVIEANHDVEMLARGPYPPSLKQRVGGFWGHLNNQQCADLVEQQDLKRLQHLAIAHISQKNNSLERVLAALNAISLPKDKLRLICQNDGLPWCVLNPAGQVPDNC